MGTILTACPAGKKKKLVGVQLFVTSYPTCISVLVVSIAKPKDCMESASQTAVQVIHGKDKWTKLAYMVLGLTFSQLNVRLEGELPDNFKDTLLHLSDGFLAEKPELF